MSKDDYEKTGIGNTGYTCRKSLTQIVKKDDIVGKLVLDKREMNCCFRKIGSEIRKGIFFLVTFIFIADAYIGQYLRKCYPWL